MDISDYEDADYTHDLNNPVPEELHEAFDLVIDGGTMEHLFDIKQCLENITRMVKIGGRIIHISPTNNFSGHGLYQFSPDLFYDFYSINKFENLNGLYVVSPIKTLLSKIYGNPKLDSWEAFRLNHNYYGKMFVSKHPAGIYFTAEKTKQSSFNKIPQQGGYYRNNLLKKNQDTMAPILKKQNFVQSLKVITKPLFRRKPFVWIRDYYRKRQKINLHKQPWGLKSDGKL